MPNALSQFRASLQPKPGKLVHSPAVLRILAIDSDHLLRVVRMAIDTVRSMKLLVSRMGPFDDSRIAETGFFVAGQASALAKLKKIVEGKAAKAGIPILVSEYGVKPAAGSVAEALDHATGEMLEGGPGSGHFGHKGRKGHLGGSLPGAARLAGDVKLNSIYVRGEEGGFDALLSRFPKLGKAWREAHAAGNGQNVRSFGRKYRVDVHRSGRGWRWDDAGC